MLLMMVTSAREPFVSCRLFTLPEGEQVTEQFTER